MVTFIAYLIHGLKSLIAPADDAMNYYVHVTETEYTLLELKCTAHRVGYQHSLFSNICLSNKLIKYSDLK